MGEGVIHRELSAVFNCQGQSPISCARRLITRHRHLCAFFGPIMRHALATLLGSVCIAVAMTEVAHGQPTAQPSDPNLAAIRIILQTPEADIDLAKTKLAIDHLIDPSIDVAASLSQIDAMAQGIKAMLPTNASRRLTLDALRFHLYQPSPWNGKRPFRYDLEDPYGANVRNKLMPSYLVTRKGNCVSMPLLFIILGQKLGIDVTAASAPNHLFVKFRDTDGKLYNLETTSGAEFTRDVWIRQQSPMTDEALTSGIYMRPMTKKETAVVMVEALLDFYGQQGLNYQRIAMAKLALAYSPRDISAILHQRSAYFALTKSEFYSRYPSSNDIPSEKRPRFMELESNLKTLYERAYTLGWRPLDRASEDKYQQNIKRARSKQ
jgi:regulator of sirC expression with transglutaminase-like and TPR domain